MAGEPFESEDTDGLGPRYGVAGRSVPAPQQWATPVLGRVPAMPKPNTGFAASGDGRIAYETAGEGMAVLFVHAGVADRRMWDPQFAAIPDGFRFVRIDLRGHGDSELGEVPFSNHDDVIAVLDHLGTDSAVVVGCSLGGGTAIDVALTAPDRVAGLLLVGTDSPGYEAEEYEPPQWQELVRAFEAGDLERVAELDAEIWVIGHGRTLDDVDRSVFDLVVEMDRIPLSTETRRDQLTVRLDPARAERMDEISVPTMVAVGEHDLPDIRESAGHLAGALSHHELVVIPGAAHLPSLEQPEEFNRVLIGFLRSFSV